MTAVQLQTEAPVVTASGQQVQTLQVVVSPPPCVSVMTVLQRMSLHAPTTAVFHDISVLFGSSALPPACPKLPELHVPQHSVMFVVLQFPLTLSSVSKDCLSELGLGDME